MSTTRRAHALLSLAVLGATALTAGAQHAVPEHARAAVSATTASAAAAPRPLATYRFTGWRGPGMPTQVVVADSAGQLVASFRASGARTVHPMTLTVQGADIVLRGDTPAGVLVLRLHGQQEPEAAGVLIGSWSLGTRQGELRGRSEWARVATAPE